MASQPSTIPIPQTIGACIEALLAEQGKRSAVMEIANEHKANEEALEAAILEKLKEQGLDRATHAGYVAKRDDKAFFGIQDDKLLGKYIQKTGYIHLFQRRLSVEGCRELMQTKGVIPGVVVTTIPTLSFTKSRS